MFGVKTKMHLKDYTLEEAVNYALTLQPEDPLYILASKFENEENINEEELASCDDYINDLEQQLEDLESDIEHENDRSIELTEKIKSMESVLSTIVDEVEKGLDPEMDREKILIKIQELVNQEF